MKFIDQTKSEPNQHSNSIIISTDLTTLILPQTCGSLTMLPVCLHARLSHCESVRASECLHLFPSPASYLSPLKMHQSGSGNGCLPAHAENQRSTKTDVKREQCDVLKKRRAGRWFCCPAQLPSGIGARFRIRAGKSSTKKLSPTRSCHVSTACSSTKDFDMLLTTRSNYQGNQSSKSRSPDPTVELCAGESTFAMSERPSSKTENKMKINI